MKLDEIKNLCYTIYELKRKEDDPMVYRVDISKSKTYHINATSEAEARLTAINLFKNIAPLIHCNALAPCQVDGKCPYNSAHSCDLCMRKENT